MQGLDFLFGIRCFRNAKACSKATAAPCQRPLHSQAFARYCHPRWGPRSGITASVAMDTLGFEPRAFRMRSGCDTTTPCALACGCSGLHLGGPRSGDAAAAAGAPRAPTANCVADQAATLAASLPQATWHAFSRPSAQCSQQRPRGPGGEHRGTLRQLVQGAQRACSRNTGPTCRCFHRGPRKLGAHPWRSREERATFIEALRSRRAPQGEAGPGVQD
jgi:hypothetical protein